MPRGLGYDYRGGTDFIQSLLRTAGRKELKVIYGTRTGKWYVIDKEDRDWATTWALTFTEANALGEAEARLQSTRGRAL